MKRKRDTPSAQTTQRTEVTPWIDIVAAKVKTLNYGIIEIVIHDGRVVQIERKENLRFDDSGSLQKPNGGDSDPAETTADEI